MPFDAFWIILTLLQPIQEQRPLPQIQISKLVSTHQSVIDSSAPASQLRNSRRGVTALICDWIIHPSTSTTSKTQVRFLFGRATSKPNNVLVAASAAVLVGGCNGSAGNRFEQFSEVERAWNDATGQRKAPITPQSIDLAHDQKRILRAQRAPALWQSRKGKGRTN